MRFLKSLCGLILPVGILAGFSVGGAVLAEGSILNDPTDPGLSGTVTIGSKVEVESSVTIPDSGFEFELWEVHSDSDDTLVESVAVNQAGTFEFTPISYTEIGSYEYTIYQVDKAADGFTYDLNPIAVTVTVVDGGTGSLDATATYDPNENVFHNQYNAAPVSVPLTVTTTINGKTDSTQEFIFDLVGPESSDPIETMSIIGSSSGTFTPLVFDAEGEYSYTISDDDHITYSTDTDFYVVKVSVSESGGKLNATTTIERHFGSDYETVNDIVFEYEYSTTFNVTDYGAVADDNRTDSAAIQYVLNLANEIDDPITVIIPRGTYTLTQNLKIYSNTTIQAADDATIIADYGYDGGVSIISGSHLDADGNICSGNTCTHGGYTAIENITISGGIWDRNIATDSSSAFIFRHGNNITIENLTVKNCTDHFINVSGCNNVTISYVNFQDAKKCPDGEHYWEGWTSRDDSRYYISEAVHTDFTNEEGEKSDYAKPWDNTPARNITVDHCTFTNVHAGVGNHHNAVGDRGGNFTVTNNTFDNVGSYCFYGCDYDTVIFSNNTATDCNTMILVYGCSKVTVSDNTITSTHGGSTDDYKRDIIHFNNVSTGTIKNNTISGAQNSGIQVCEGSKNIIIDNNKVNSSNAFGILARSASAITCKNNKVNGTTVNDAIKYESCSGTNKITGNTITSAKYDGINVTNSVTTEVSGNTISGVGNRGISVMSSNNTTIKSNTITSAPQAGITIEGTSAAKIKVTCSDNIIKKPGADGIMVKYADQSTISNNKITSPGNDGINVADSNKCSVTDNEISSAVKRGIVVSRSNGATVKNNTITSPKLSGIWIEGSEKAPSAVTCDGNKITNPGEYGVGLKYADGSSVTNNTITKPVKDGINATVSKNCKINNNEISNAGRNGIGLSCSKGTTVNANKINSPTNIGIYSEGTTSDYSLGKITAKNNTITSSGSDGISVKYGDSSVVNDNTITKAGRRGIMIKESANCTVNGNTIKSTTEIPIFVEGSASKKASANVSDNTLQTSDNTKVDLRTGTNSTVRISGNTFMNNKTYSTADGSETIDTGSSTVITPIPTVITPTPTVKPAIAPTVIPTPTTAPKPTTAPQNTESGVAGFVERLYSVALGRPSDPYGKADWVNRVRTEGYTGADLARGFLFSDEFLSKSMSNSEFLDVLYATFFNRPADEGGKNNWLALMDQGWGKKDVIDGFINSIEWANLCLTYGIASGTTAQPNITIEPNDNIIGFATRLYTTCLGREADPGGLMDWATQLANMKISGSDAAHGFFFSQEFLDADIDDAEYVKRLYRTFMGREYDQGGFDNWMNALASGQTREDVFRGFAGSQEWANICAEYGILK